MLVGANPDELDRLAGNLDTSADKVKGVHGDALLLIRQSPWKGADAEHYEELWRSIARARIDEAASLLHDAADSLRRNAEQQRKTSEADADGFASSLPPTPVTPPGTGVSAVPGAPEEEDPEEAEWLKVAHILEKALSALGMTGSALEGALMTMRGLFNAGILDAQTLSLLDGLAHNDGLLSFFKTAGKVIEPASLLIGFITDIGDHPELSWDERLVHGIVETGLKFAVSEGLEYAGTAIGTALGTMAGGIGAAPGYMVGKGIGIVLGVAFEAADNHFEITDMAADQAVEFYRYAKEHDFDPGAMAMDKANEMANDLADGAKDFASDVAGGAKDVAGDVADGAKDVANDAVEGAKDVGNFLNPF